MTVGSIYILETDDGALVKIGYSGKLTMRLDQHRRFMQSVSPKGLRLLGFFPGTRDTETAIHRHFADCRVNGDWYDRCRAMQRLLSFGAFSPRPLVMSAQEEGCSPTYQQNAVAQAMVAMRNKKLSPARKKEIAQKAAAARWKDREDSSTSSKPKT